MGLGHDVDNLIHWKNSEKNHRWGIIGMIGTPSILELESTAHMYLTTNQHASSFAITLSAFNGAHHTVYIERYQPSISDSLWVYKFRLVILKLLSEIQKTNQTN